MKDVYEYLDSIGVKYFKHEHPAIFTVEDGKQLKLETMPGLHTKNLFLRNKSGNKHYLVSIESSKMADLSKLKEFLGESKLSFASPERLLDHLGLTPGSVSPFGLINDHGSVIYVLDKDLAEAEIVNFHPNINTATLGVSRDDFMKFLKSVGNEVRMIEV